MPVELFARPKAGSKPIHCIGEDGLENMDLPERARAWAEATDYKAKNGKVLLVPDTDGGIDCAIIALDDSPEDALHAGQLARSLPAGDWHFEKPPPNAVLATLGAVLGGYAFTAYGKEPSRRIGLACPDGVEPVEIERLAQGTALTRDLINTPTNDMGPEALERIVRQLGEKHGASVQVITGDALLDRNLPMIHAVGRASAEAPRLIDLTWGDENAPKVTLVGKGVCFDTGGLDIKPAASMLLMKKDMGGAANVIGLASMIMAAKLPVRLRVLIPAVENSISANAFRPSDILKSRKGITVEIGNTDAEGRLVLADALALADEEAPQMLIDMATLTGAARVALGPELPPFFTDDELLAAELSDASQKTADPLWRLPLFKLYAERLSSKVADTNNITSDGFAGAITAALFLQKFVERAESWVHFDIYGWTKFAKPWAPVGGEAMGIRAIDRMLQQRFGR
ncbi:M17 family metallopeptidase [Notoacmeibacter sp. MSK16QG-6]|uniref:leucyl aminopeptidase family protein n=1 Tax=Notoacmeibacter sp. MSK16QG-6 TaxID=2957982 RepID=UPI0020A0B0D6|nr:leucyl aminopeptidase family protein [Notoacmeibacter sp. MSK16QG-6]MCP1198760.1 leucyl aminopeptidase family protein [Notoacmeibacter sp. MSK16QG-6]